MLKTWWNRTFARKSGPTKRISSKRTLRIEPLEERTLLTINVQVVPPTWQFEGPTITDPPPNFNSTAFGNGMVAYDSVSNIIFGASLANGVGYQSVPGQATLWQTAPVGATVGGPAGIVQIDNTSTPGQSIRYTSQSGLKNLTGQAFFPNNQPVSALPPTPLPLTVNGSTDQTGNPGDLTSIDLLSASAPAALAPWALNNVNPKRMIFGTNYLYESMDGGQTVDSVGGLIPAIVIGTGQDVTIDDPATAIGPVTAVDYGGTNLGGTANPDLLWVGSAGAKSLYLRTAGTGMPAAVLQYTGAAPQEIVSNPKNWQQTFIIDAFNVYETIDGGQTWTVINGNLNTFGLSSIVYVPNPAGVDYLAAGINGAVERMPLNNKNALGKIIGGTWTQLGSNLPFGADVGSLQYNAAKDLLIAGSNGGGAFELARASTAVPTNQITVDGNFSNENVNFAIVGANLSITDTAGPAPHAVALGIGTISNILVTNLAGGTSTVNLDFTNGDPVPNAPFTVDGTGSVQTTIQANAVSNYVLSNNNLNITGVNRNVTLKAVTNAQLTGVGNSFDVSGWTHTGTLIGLGVNNTVVSTNDSNFTLNGGQGITTGQLTVATGTNMVLNNISNALLSGGVSANTFNVTGWTGTGIITGNGGADSLTQTGNSGYTYSSTQMSSTLGTALNLVGIPIQNYTAGANGAAFLDNGLTGGAAAFLTGQAGKANTITSQQNANFTLNNTQIIGGTGTDNLVNPATFTAINITGGANPHTIDVSAYTNGGITPTLTAAADTLLATVAANTDTFTLSNAALNITAVGAPRNVNYNLGALAAINLTGGAGTNTFNVNSWSHPGNFNGSIGSSTYNIGGAVGAGNLNNITGKLTLTSIGGGNNQLNVNDATNAQGTSYQLANSLISINTVTSPARPTALGGVGLAYNAAIGKVTVHGSKGADKYIVTPSATTQFTADNSAASAANGFLGTVFLGTTSHTQHVAGNNGFWSMTTAANPQPLNVNWVNIASTNMNGLGLIVLGGGTQPSNTSQPIIQVYDAETGLLTSQFLAYPSTFQLGVKVASGGNLGGATGPVIITAPGRGIAGTVNFYTKTTLPAGTVNATTPQGTLPAATIGNFQPYGATFTDGINIAVGMVNPVTNLPDLIVAPQRDALPVKVYTLTNTGTPAAPHIAATLKGSFMAYPASYIGGVNVAGGNILGHGVTDVVTAPQSGMQATVEIWDGTTITGTTATLFRSFLAMPSAFHGGVSLAVGDVNGDGFLDIVTGAGSTGGSIVEVFNGVSILNKAVTLGIIGSSTTVNGSLVPPFAAYTDPSNFAPVSVALKDVDGSGQLTIVTAQGTNGKSNLLRYWKVNPGGNPPVFQYPNTLVGAPPTPLGGLSLG